MAISQPVVIDEISMLPDGKMECLTGLNKVYVQPEAKVRVVNINNATMLLIKGKLGSSAYIDTTITQINSEAFSGTFADLELLISEFVKDCNSVWGTGKISANHPSQQELTDPSSVVFDDWNKIDFACSGTITVTIDGNSIIYPYTLGSSTVLGGSLESDSITNNPITFDGTGTVLVNIKK
jgi:hypothetical protein